MSDFWCDILDDRLEARNPSDIERPKYTIKIRHTNYIFYCSGASITFLFKLFTEFCFDKPRCKFNTRTQSQNFHFSALFVRIMWLCMFKHSLFCRYNAFQVVFHLQKSELSIVHLMWQIWCPALKKTLACNSMIIWNYISCMSLPFQSAYVGENMLINSLSSWCLGAQTCWCINWQCREHDGNILRSNDRNNQFELKVYILFGLILTNWPSLFRMRFNNTSKTVFKLQ